MSREYTNYQTLVQAKQKIMAEFEEKKRAVRERDAINKRLGDTFQGEAATAYEAASSALINAIDTEQVKASNKLDKDIATWYDRLDDAEKRSAQEFREKIGL